MAIFSSPPASVWSLLAQRTSILAQKTPAFQRLWLRFLDNPEHHGQVIRTRKALPSLSHLLRQDILKRAEFNGPGDRGPLVTRLPAARQVQHPASIHPPRLFEI